MHSVTENIIIRPATLTDLDSLCTFENQSFTADKMSRQSFYALLKKNTATILIAHDNQAIVGLATTLFRTNTNKARLYSFAIAAQYHGSGLAHQLLTEVEKNARQRNCKELILEVRLDNIRAIQFYKKHHFVSFSTFFQFYADGTDAIRMKKTLT